KGTTVTIDGPHSFHSVHLIDGAVLTHSSDTATQTHKLDLSVTSQVIVDAASRIDVTGKGYVGASGTTPGRTTGNTTVGGAQGYSGGSYGGSGVVGDPRGSTNRTYGDYADPDDWGSGGGNAWGYDAGGSGGGLARIAAATLALDGQVLADGAPGDG